MPEPSQEHFKESRNTSHAPPIDNKYVSLHDLIGQKEPKKYSFTWFMRYVYKLFRPIFPTYKTEKTYSQSLFRIFNLSNDKTHSSSFSLNKHKAQHKKYEKPRIREDQSYKYDKK